MIKKFSKIIFLKIFPKVKKAQKNSTGTHLLENGRNFLMRRGKTSWKN